MVTLTPPGFISAGFGSAGGIVKRFDILIALFQGGEGLVIDLDGGFASRVDRFSDRQIPLRREIHEFVVLGANAIMVDGMNRRILVIGVVNGIPPVRVLPPSRRGV